MFVAAVQHRNTLTEIQHHQGVTKLSGTKLQCLFLPARSFLAAVPAIVVVGTVPVILAVGLVVLLIVGHRVHQGKSVMACQIVHDRMTLRIFPLSPDKSRDHALVALQETTDIHHKTVVIFCQIAETRNSTPVVNLIQSEALGHDFRVAEKRLLGQCLHRRMIPVYVNSVYVVFQYPVADAVQYTGSLHGFWEIEFQHQLNAVFMQLLYQRF